MLGVARVNLPREFFRDSRSSSSLSRRDIIKCDFTSGRVDGIGIGVKLSRSSSRAREKDRERCAPRLVIICRPRHKSVSIFEPRPKSLFKFILSRVTSTGKRTRSGCGGLVIVRCLINNDSASLLETLGPPFQIESKV